MLPDESIIKARSTLVLQLFQANQVQKEKTKQNKNITKESQIKITVITLTSGLDTQTRLIGHFPLF